MNSKMKSMMAMYAMMAFTPPNWYYPGERNTPKKIVKPIPNGCQEFKIGKYSVVAINRKNAVRKALKLRAKDV